MANSANSAKCEAPSASAADIASERNVRSQRNDGGAELIHLPEFAHFADSAALQNQPPTRMDVDTSQISHISQAEDKELSDDDMEVF